METHRQVIERCEDRLADINDIDDCLIVVALRLHNPNYVRENIQEIEKARTYLDHVRTSLIRERRAAILTYRRKEEWQ